MKKSNSPEAKLLELLFTDPKIGVTALRDFLPKNVVERFDPDHVPVLMDGPALDEEENGTQSDVTLRVKLTGGNEAIVDILLQHAENTAPPDRAPSHDPQTQYLGQ